MNIFACLVHENPGCVVDLVRNLRDCDPASVVVIYDGSQDGGLLSGLDLDNEDGVLIHPQPRPMSWGRLHDFALDCMRMAVDRPGFDSITIVDSDQLAVRRGYSAHLQAFLASHAAAGCLVSAPGVQPRHTRVGPPEAAWRELELWRPFLRRFPDGERQFPHWTFWPATVFTRRGVEALLALWGDEELQNIMARSNIWATEEVVLPSLVALTGHQVLRNPCSYDYVQYRTAYSSAQVDTALSRHDVYWMHPVPRDYDDPIRSRIRTELEEYRQPERWAPDPFGEASRPLAPLLPLLRRMEAIEGWLSAEEADLLAAAATRALAELPAPHHFVEVGSYCGRATVVLGTVAASVQPAARVHAIDPHDGVLGTRARAVAGHADSERRLHATLERANLTEVVTPVCARADGVAWEAPISLLLVDHLHDLASVTADLAAFEPWLVQGGLVAFHDYCDDFPGVRELVNHLLRTATYRALGRAGTMVVLEKVAAIELPADREQCDDDALLALIGAGPDEVVVIDETHDYPSFVAAARRASSSLAGGGYLAVRRPARGPGIRAYASYLRHEGSFEPINELSDLLIVRKQATAARAAPQDAATTKKAAAPWTTAARPADRPFVSCIMPTHNRRRLVPQAIRYFLRQNFEEAELIVVDDGTDPVRDLIPDHPRVKYIHVDGRRTIGAKRNLACAQAQGELIVHWDDDDWMADHRLRYQVDGFLADDVDVCGLRELLFYEASTRRCWRYEYPENRQPWVADATFCYHRSLWERAPFADTTYGIDAGYLWDGPPKRVRALGDSSFYVAMIHAKNTSRKETQDAWWHPHPTETIASLLGADLAFYEQLGG